MDSLVHLHHSGLSVMTTLFNQYNLTIIQYYKIYPLWYINAVTLNVGCGEAVAVVSVF